MIFPLEFSQDYVDESSQWATPASVRAVTIERICFMKDTQALFVAQNRKKEGIAIMMFFYFSMCLCCAKIMCFSGL